jgi:hypothetical protein
MKIITDEVIKKDIAGYWQRIQKVKKKLACLPVTADTWKERKRL